MRVRSVVVCMFAVWLGGCAPSHNAGPASTAVEDGSDRSIDPKGWTITTPAATNAVRVAFPEPIDHGVLDALGVLAPVGSPLPGEVFVAEDSRMWQFTPKSAWLEGQYQLAGFGRPLIPFSVR